MFCFSLSRTVQKIFLDSDVAGRIFEQTTTHQPFVMLPARFEILEGEPSSMETVAGCEGRMFWRNFRIGSQGNIKQPQSNDIPGYQGSMF